MSAVGTKLTSSDVRSEVRFRGEWRTWLQRPGMSGYDPDRASARLGGAPGGSQVRQLATTTTSSAMSRIGDCGASASQRGIYIAGLAILRDLRMLWCTTFTVHSHMKLNGVHDANSI